MTQEQRDKIYDLRKRMMQGRVAFRFKKVNGEIRNAIGTLDEYSIPTQVAPTLRTSKPRKFNEDIFLYYDCEQCAYRSFKKENFIEIINSNTL